MEEPSAPPNKIHKHLMNVAYVLGIIILIFIIFWLLKHVLLVVIMMALALIFAYAIEPIVSFFNNLNLPLIKKKMPRSLAIVITYAIIFSLLFTFFSFVVPVVKKEALDLQKNFPEIKATFEKQLASYLERLPEYARDYINLNFTRFMEELEKTGLELLQKSLVFVVKFFSMVAIGFIIPILSFYILHDGESYRKNIISLLPPHKQERIICLIDQINQVVGGFIRGQIVVCLIIGATATIAMLALKIKYAFLIGIFVTIMDAIPYVGAVAGAIPAVILALIFHSPLWALLVAGVFYAIYWTEGHFVAPPILGHSVGLSPLTVMVALIIGAELLGIFGMFVAVPVAAVVRVIVNHVFPRYEVISCHCKKEETQEENKTNITETK